MGEGWPVDSDSLMKELKEQFGTLQGMREGLVLMVNFYQDNPKINISLYELMDDIDASSNNFEEQELMKKIISSSSFFRVQNSSNQIYLLDQLFKEQDRIAGITTEDKATWATPSDIAQMSIKEETKKIQRIFCKICLENFDYADHVLSFTNCGHTYCKECLRQYFTTQITDGGIFNLKCPGLDCKKDVHLRDIYSLITKDVLQLYKKLMFLASLKIEIPNIQNVNNTKQSTKWQSSGYRAIDQSLPYIPPPKQDRSRKIKENTLKVGKYAGYGVAAVAVVALSVPVVVVGAPVYGAYRVGKAIKTKSVYEKPSKKNVQTRIRDIKKEDEDENVDKNREQEKLDRKEELEEEHKARVQTRTLGVFSRIRPMRN